MENFTSGAAMSDEVDGANALVGCLMILATFCISVLALTVVFL